MYVIYEVYINPNKKPLNGDETNSINEKYQLWIAIIIRMNEFDVEKNCYESW